MWQVTVQSQCTAMTNTKAVRHTVVLNTNWVFSTQKKDSDCTLPYENKTTNSWSIFLNAMTKPNWRSSASIHDTVWHLKHHLQLYCKSATRGDSVIAVSQSASFNLIHFHALTGGKFVQKRCMYSATLTCAVESKDCFRVWKIKTWIWA